MKDPNAPAKAKANRERKAAVESDGFQWIGDLDDDCTCEWRGLILRAEAMGPRMWWWAIYRQRDELASSNDIGGWTCPATGNLARLLAEHAAMKFILNPKQPKQPV